MKVYKTSNYGIEIEEMEVIRETKDYYYVTQKWDGKERREIKVSSYYRCHSTRNEAENYLLNRIDTHIRYKQEEIERLKKDRLKLLESAGKD